MARPPPRPDSSGCWRASSRQKESMVEMRSWEGRSSRFQPRVWECRSARRARVDMEKSSSAAVCYGVADGVSERYPSGAKARAVKAELTYGLKPLPFNTDSPAAPDFSGTADPSTG